MGRVPYAIYHSLIERIPRDSYRRQVEFRTISSNKLV